MATLEEIRAALVARTQTVAEIGQVHDHEPYARESAALLAMYKSQVAGRDVVLGWFWRRVATLTGGGANTRRAVTHEWQLRGYMGLDEENGSEKVFDGKVEALRAAFALPFEAPLPSIDVRHEDGIGLQVVECVPVMFAGMLCHAAECRLYTTLHQ